MRSSDLICLLLCSKYNPNTGRHEYDIFRPPSTWYYSSGSAPKPLKQHYIFKEIERALNQSFESNNRLTAAFSYKDYVVVFQRSKYYTLRLNQTNCDTNTDLSLTVEGLQIFDDFPMEPISVFFYNTDIHFFTKSGSGYEYQIYQSASISQVFIPCVLKMFILFLLFLFERAVKLMEGLKLKQCSEISSIVELRLQIQ